MRKTVRYVVRTVFGIFPLDKSEPFSDYSGVNGHAHLIDQLGGGTAVATALWGDIGPKGKRREVVYKWKRNGIPWRWRHPVERLARERGVEIPAEFLDPGHDAAGSAQAA